MVLMLAAGSRPPVPLPPTPRRIGLAGAFPSLLLLPGVFLFLPGGTSAQSTYFPPPGEWERRAPSAVGMNGAALDQAVAFARANENPAPRDLSVAHFLSWGREPHDAPVGPFTQRGEVSGFVIKDGYIVAEWGDTRAVEMTFSVTKSFLSATVGLIWDRGYIPDLHAPVRMLVPTEHFASDHNRRITWDHLMRQTSDWQGDLWGKPDWADRPGDDVLANMTRERDEPGTAYKYNDVRVNLLAYAALQVYRTPLPVLLREELMEPIGASASWRWHGYETSWVELDGQHVQSVSGGGHWGGGMFISAEDLARFGYLTLREGRWRDRQILSRDWLELSATPGTVNRGYGYMNFFLNTDRRLMPFAPESAYRHVGAGNNIVYVDRENDLVVVVRWIRGGALNPFLEQVVASLEE